MGAGGRPWAAASVAALAAVALLPIVWPASTAPVQRLAPLLSLFFFLSAVGHWLRLGRRSFSVAGVLTSILYAATAWSPRAFGLEDFFGVALLSSFLIFALAGFNLVFIIEEAVFDVQRHVRAQGPWWRFGPTVTVAVLAWTLPFLPGARVTALWVACILSLLLMGGWWFVRAFNTLDEGPVLRELHILVASSVAMAAAIDAIRLVAATRGLLPSLLAYVLLVGTWLYVSYTTLQRTSFLMGARNEVPWLLILLAASFALVQHAQFHYRIEGHVGITVLLNQRLAYLVVGMGVGMAFYLAQSSWRVLQSMRDDRRLSPRGRIIAGRLARLAEEVFTAEQRLIEGTAYQVYRGVDQMISGRRGRPRWELDPQTGVLRVMEEE